MTDDADIPPAVNPGIQLPGPFAPIAEPRSFVFGWRHLCGPWNGYETGWDFDDDEDDEDDVPQQMTDDDDQPLTFDDGQPMTEG